MNKTISIASARRQQMDRALPSAKSIAFPVDSIIRLHSLETATYKDRNGEELPNDKFVAEVQAPDGKITKCTFPVREILKATVAEGSKAMYSEEGKQTHFATELKIVGAEARKDRNGEEVFPVQCYNAFESQLEAGNGIDWNGLVASGVKEDNDLSPVQNYTFFIG